MKITNNALLLLLLLSASIGFVSCTGVSEQRGVSGEGLDLISSSKITFTFDAPKGLPTTYAIHDEPEWDIKDKSITVYEFVSRGGTYKESTYVKTHHLSLTPKGSAKYSAELQESDLGDAGALKTMNRCFLFVANNKEDLTLTASHTFDKVEQMAMTATQRANASCKDLLQDEKFLPMTGVATTKNGEHMIPVGGKDVQVSVDLIRTVARIDIRTTMQPSLTHPEYKSLVIRGAVLKNSVSGTTLGQQRLATPSRVSGILPYASIPATGVEPEKAIESNGVPGKLAKAFYLYETPITYSVKDEMPVVEISFTYGADNTLHKVEVPFFEKGRAIPVLRNHLYTIVLGPKNSLNQGVAYAIAVGEWKGEVDVKQVLSPIVSEGNVSGFNAKTHTLDVPVTGNSSGYVIPFRSQFVGSASEFSANLKEPASWLTVMGGSRITITNVQPNTTGKERTAVVQVEDKSAPGVYTYELKITQKAQ